MPTPKHVQETVDHMASFLSSREESILESGIEPPTSSLVVTNKTRL